METAPHGRESAEQTPERPGAPTDPQTGSGGLPETHHEAAVPDGVTEVGQDPASQHYDKVPDPADGCHWCACGNRWPCKDATAPTEAYPVGGENAQEGTR